MGNNVFVLKTLEVLESYVGQQVTVWIGAGDRNSFHTQVSVSGILEQNEHQFRILVNEGTYTYFDASNVIEGGDYGHKKFKDGSQAVFRIEI